MAPNGGVSEQLRSDSDPHRSNGKAPHSRVVRESEPRDVDYSATDAEWVYEHLGTWDRLAMVVRKTAARMKNSSWAERLVAALLAALLSVMIYIATSVADMEDQMSTLNREVGEALITIDNHITNHPNVPIENDVEELERWRFEHERRGHSPAR